MSVRANWGLQALESSAGPEVDPFGSALSVLMTTRALPDWMLPVSIETETEELERKLSALTRREARFFDNGVICGLKGRGEMSCLACPFSTADDDDSEMSGLCRIGCDQERVATLLIAQRHRPDNGQ